MFTVGTAALALAALPESLRSPRILAAFALSSILLEIALAFAFWPRRARVPAVLAGACFHLMMVVTIAPAVSVRLAVFAVVMLSLYPLFFAGPVPKPSATRVPQVCKPVGTGSTMSAADGNV